MSESLPNNWIKTTVGEVSNRITKGSTPTSYGYTYKDDGIKFIKTENVDQNGDIQNIKTFIDEETNKFLKRSILKKNDVLFSIAGTIGRVGIVKENDLPANTNQALAIVRSYWDLINVRYLFYLLRSNYAQKQAGGSIVGVGRSNISLKNISDFKIPLPPLSEQHCIVAKIEELLTKLDAGVDALKQVQAQLKRYRQSVLKAAVEGRLTAEWREQHKDELEPADILLDRILKERREKWEAEQLAKYEAQGKTSPKNWRDNYKEPAPPDTTDLLELPEGWAYMGLVQYAQDNQHSIKRGPFGSAIKKEFFTSEGYKVYEQKNVIYNDFKLGNYFIDQKKFNELKNFMVKKGDILISCSGTIGEIAIVPEDFQAGVINQALLKISLNENLILTKYFVYLFKSKLQEVLITKTRGSAMKNIASVQALKEIPFGIPIVKEQRQILNEIEKYYTIAGKVEENLNFELNRSQSLRQSILKRAFEGQLVPQNPNDEPASVLLERIKAEKANKKKTKQLEMF